MSVSVNNSKAAFEAQVIGGPTILINYGGLRLLTDPTFDDSREYAGAVPLAKTVASPISSDEIGRVDLVLLSHDEHPDNLDIAGREFLKKVPLTLTTVSGAARLGGTATGLEPWQSVEMVRPNGGRVTITATTAQHGPEGSLPVVGDVIGFVLSGEGLPTVYISGDNASLQVVEEVARRFTIEEAVLFAGAVKQPVVRPEADLLTLDAERAVQATRILGPKKVLIAHVDSWAHFTEDLEATVEAFDRAGLGNLLTRR